MARPPGQSPIASISRLMGLVALVAVALALPVGIREAVLFQVAILAFFMAPLGLLGLLVRRLGPRGRTGSAGAATSQVRDASD